MSIFDLIEIMNREMGGQSMAASYNCPNDSSGYWEAESRLRELLKED